MLKLPINVNKVGKGGGGCTYPVTYKHGFCWISASPFRSVISLSLLFSDTAVILWQEAIVVQVNILQCTSKHLIPHAGEYLSIQITRMIEHFALTLFLFLSSHNYSEIADRAQVLTSFNCLRNRELHIIYDAM